MREEKLSLVWKKKALDAFAFTPIENITTMDAFAFTPIEKITTMKIQIKLQVGYHLALKIKDWLVQIKGRCE